jgi:hypothetical protein
VANWTRQFCPFKSHPQHIHCAGGVSLVHWRASESVVDTLPTALDSKTQFAPIIHGACV